MASISFSRQKAFLGSNNQTLIEQSTVAIVGMGGLGSVAAHLLVRMGVGTLICIDADSVADHNLSRQHLYGVSDIGTPKVIAAKRALEQINPECTIVTHSVMLLSKDDSSLCNDADLILDCTDSHAARRIIESIADTLRLPWIHAAAIGDIGTVLYFNPSNSAYLRYDDIYPNKTDTSCDLSGVLATATTLIATLQVRLAIDVLTGKSVEQKLLRYDGESGTVSTFHVKR